MLSEIIDFLDENGVVKKNKEASSKYEYIEAPEIIQDSDLQVPKIEDETEEEIEKPQNTKSNKDREILSSFSSQKDNKETPKSKIEKKEKLEVDSSEEVNAAEEDEKIIKELNAKKEELLKKRQNNESKGKIIRRE